MSAISLLRPLSRPLDALLDWFYPRHCYHCGEVLSQAGQRLLCAECSVWLAGALIGENICSLCGLPLPMGAGSDKMCGMCQSHPPAFDLARSFFSYASPVASIIRSFKFHGEFRAGPRFLGNLLERGWMPRKIRDVDAVVPVPLHWWRRRERGYNQSRLLARALSRHVGAPLIARKLIRTRYTAQQALLTTKKRRQNVRGAFKVRHKNAFAHLHVLLVDDVMTSGATADECARMLKKAGAGRVSVLTLARTLP